jgi:DEAD/DEAH box helicase domain-containing protein
MFGLLHAMKSVATLLLMCDGRDLGTALGERPPSPDSDSEGLTPLRMEDAVGTNAREFFEANLYLYDAYPGGIGFSEPLFRAHQMLIEQTRELIRACPCPGGCPSCVGPVGDLAPRAKAAALTILDCLCQ